MPYIPNTDEDRKRMLHALGLSSTRELFSPVPEHLLLQRELKMAEPLPEVEIYDYFERMGRSNQIFPAKRNLAGGGVYRHFIPPVVKELVHRGEFYTSYTPYQAEVSQGILQCVYEYQSFVCMLTGMEASNASSYDGATALADAVLMAANIVHRKRVLLPPFLHPQYGEVLQTYSQGRMLATTVLPATEQGSIETKALQRELAAKDVAALVLQVPDFLGYIEPEIPELAARAHEQGAMVVFVVHPLATGVMKSPGDLGADIVAGDGQPLGLPASFGGPSFGFLATKKRYIHQLPGRIVGRTTAAEGKTAFVLTLQAREQHIRRERASSNICTNQELAAVQATIYLAALGRSGFHNVARKCEENAHYACAKLCEIPGVEHLFSERQWFNEFSLRLPSAQVVDSAYAGLMEKGWLPGIKLGELFPQLQEGLSLAFTEVHSPSDIDAFAADFREVLG
ncbi:MAG: glycine dehydrogenase (aminomethyl-transferring) [Planctomycetales bacterium 4484_113]|nr:MAG: glycine dehydrogenase (aminomethyl-transferring) [Planctomycetales bacterium 4484_113]